MLLIPKVCLPTQTINNYISISTFYIIYTDSKASSADIRGYTTYDVDLSRIEFNILTTIPESSSTIYMICDGTFLLFYFFFFVILCGLLSTYIYTGVQVPKVTTKGQDNLTIIVMHDGL